jgi:hypothetical protein
MHRLRFSDLAVAPAHEKISAIFLALRALHLHPVAFARFVGRVFSLGHDPSSPLFVRKMV